MLGTAERSEPFNFNLMHFQFYSHIQRITYSQDILFWCCDALIYTTCRTKERTGELDGGMEMVSGKHGGGGEKGETKVNGIN